MAYDLLEAEKSSDGYEVIEPEQPSQNDLPAALSRLAPVGPMVEQIEAPAKMDAEMLASMSPEERERALGPSDTLGIVFDPFAPLPRFKGESTTGKIAAGVGNVGMGALEGMESVGGVLSLGLGGAPPWLMRLAGLGFGASMAPAAGERIGTASVTGDPQDIAEAAGTTALTVLPQASRKSGVHGFGSEVPITLGDRLRLFNRDIETQPIPDMAQRSPIRQLGVESPPINPFFNPGMMDIAAQAMREAKGNEVVIPGQEPALLNLRRQFQPQIDPVTQNIAERPGGGPATGGQISFASPAEAGAIPSARQSAGGKAPARNIREVKIIDKEGGSDATQNGTQPIGGGPEHPGTPPGENLRENKAEVRGEKSAEAVDSNRADESRSESKEITDIKPEDTSTEYATGGRGSRPALTEKWTATVSDKLSETKAWVDLTKHIAKSDLALTESADSVGYALRAGGETSLPKLRAAMKARDEVLREGKEMMQSPDPAVKNEGFRQVGASQFLSEAIEAATLNSKTEKFYSNAKHAPIEVPLGETTFDAINSIKNFERPAGVESVVPLDPATGAPLTATEGLINKLEPTKPPTAKPLTREQQRQKNILERADERLAEIQKNIRSGKSFTGVTGLEPVILDGAIAIARAAIKATNSVKNGIEAAIDYIRKNHPNAKFNPEELSQWMSEHLNEETTPESAASGSATVPAKKAAAMEKSVKLPVVEDVTKLQSQLETFNKEIGDALESGGQFLEKELRPAVAKGKAAERGTVTNAEINQHFVNKLSTIRKQFNDVLSKLSRDADPASQEYMKLLRDRFELSFRQVQELRRASHESLYFWNKIKAEYQEIARSAGQMPEIKNQIPVLDQIWKDMRGKDYQAGARHFVDYLRMNLFTLGSWTLDFGTNMVVAASHAPAWALMDAIHLVSGSPAQRMGSALRALKLSGQNAIPFAKRFRLPEQLERELGNTAGAEFGGRGKEVMVDFSEILQGHPELASKLKHLDYVLGGPVRMKRAIDTFFGRFGATAELYNEAYSTGRKKGMRGDELKEYVEDFVARPPESAIVKAAQTGNEFKFNRDLSAWEEKFASNVLTKLIVEAFPRWTFQFTRWAGEMIGVDPAFARKVAKKEATADDVVKYLSKAATGWGGIVMFNQLFYDNIDANSMEYVDEKGNRTRLSGRTPAPELFFATALLRGDWDKAKAALQYISVPGARLLSGQPGGLISPLVDTIRESIQGRYTTEQTTRELTKIVNDALPGKSTLGMIRSIYDPTIREGVGAPIPGVAELLPQRTNPTTGEPLAPKQRVPGTSFELPTVGGTPFPGAQRVLNDIEKQLLNHGLGLTRPRRTSIIDLPAEDVPQEMRREYEKQVGQNVQQIVGEGIKLKEWQEAPFDVRRQVLQEWLTAARQMARVQLSEKHSAVGAPVKSTPLNISRLPEHLKK